MTDDAKYTEMPCGCARWETGSDVEPTAVWVLTEKCTQHHSVILALDADPECAGSREISEELLHVLRERETVRA